MLFLSLSSRRLELWKLQQFVVETLLLLLLLRVRKLNIEWFATFRVGGAVVLVVGCWRRECCWCSAALLDRAMIWRLHHCQEIMLCWTPLHFVLHRLHRLNKEIKSMILYKYKEVSNCVRYCIGFPKSNNVFETARAVVQHQNSRIRFNRMLINS